MKIDSHIHVTPPDIIENWEKIAEKEAYFSLLSYSKNNRFATADAVIDELDHCQYDKGVVFGFAFQDMGLCRLVNDYVIESVEKYPDRLVGFMVVSPTAPKAELEREIARCQSKGLKGLGELFAEGQHWELVDISESQSLASLCQEAALPLLIHGNEPAGHYYPGKTKDTPHKLAAFASHFPNLKIIFAHWGGGLLFYELMPEIRDALQNVYYDTAATPFLYGPQIYDTAKSLGVLHKIFMGSDYPLLSSSRHESQMYESQLSMAECAKICGENFHDFISANDSTS